MRDYAIVAPTFWTGETGRFLRSQGPEAQLVALYLLTCHSANMIGLYYLPLPTLCHETGLSPEGASKALQRAFEGGFATYDETEEVVFVHEMARFQVGERLTTKDNRHKAVVKTLEIYRKSKFYQAFIDRYGTAYELSNPSPLEGASKGLQMGERDRAPPLRSQEQEQDQEQEQEKKSAGAADDLFERFWNVFPKGRKQGKGDALKAWKTAAKKCLPETIIAAAEEYAASPVGRGQYVKSPAPWLNQQCWADDRAAWQREDSNKTTAANGRAEGKLMGLPPELAEVRAGQNGHGQM